MRLKEIMVQKGLTVAHSDGNKLCQGAILYKGSFLWAGSPGSDTEFQQSLAVDPLFRTL